MKTYEKIILILVLFVICANITVMAIENPNTKADSKPVFHGTVNINLKVGDKLDLSNSMFRIYAKDFYDGDITKNIKIIENNVNLAVAGSYNIKYSVTNSAGNSTEIVVPVVVSNDHDRTIQRKLYAGDNIWNMDLISTNRGNYHDRQNLGIYLKANTSIKVRTINQDVEITGQFLNDDEKTEKSFKIKNAWTTVTTQYDSVPFVKTLYGIDYNPIIEINLEGAYTSDSLVKPLDYYLYGDSETDFFSKWTNSGNSFAVMESDRVTFLVPYRDKGKILVEDNSKRPYYFESLVELFDFYYDLLNMYDAFIGLEDYTTEKINQNVNTKYFVKANKNGAGMAYYSKDHTAYNGNSIWYYFHKNWLILHELGHGYDDPLVSGNLYLSEAANNIFAYYYEQKYLTESDGGWLGKIPAKEKYLNNARKTITTSFNNIKNGTYTGTDQYQVRLYMMINILNKIGPEKGMAELYTQLRNNKNTGVSATVSDTIVKSFTEVSKYNVIPYMDSWKVPISTKLRKNIESQKYPIVYYLRDLVATDSKANEIKEELKLEGIYSLVTNEEIEKYGLKGNAEIKLSQEDYEKISEKDILLKSENTIFKRTKVSGTTIKIENIPVGVYEIEISSQDYSVSPRYLIVTENETNALEVSLTKLTNVMAEELVFKEVQITTPNKVNYILGEELDLSGLKVELVYTNGVRERMEDYTVTGYNKELLGKQTITINYKEYQKSYEVEVSKQIDKLPETGRFFEIGDLLKIVIVVSTVSIIVLLKKRRKA